MSKAQEEPTLPQKTDSGTDSGGKTPDAHGDHAKGTPHSDRHEAETLAGRLDKDGHAETKSK